ncbi:MAG: prepilin-type N-terminal cleavage/methylation domain-containing protein, partial [Spiribacter salinus]
RQQSGFTLIELIIVIVILGALAVVALPRFIDLEGEANQAAVEGVAGSLGAGTATNFAAVIAGNTADATQVENCEDAERTLQDEALPDNYSFSNGTQGLGSNNGSTETCTLFGEGDASAEFTGYRATY